MAINSGLNVGGEIGWDVIISIGTSLVIGIIAFTNVKNKVKQLSDTVEFLDNSISDLNNDFAKNLNAKNEELNTRLTLLETKIKDFKDVITKMESDKQIEIDKIRNDINDIKNDMNSVLKEKVIEFEDKINKINKDLNTSIEDRIANIENNLHREMDSITREIENKSNTVFKRVDELRERLEKLSDSYIELRLKIENLLFSIEKNETNVNHITELMNIRINDINSEVTRLQNDIDDFKKLLLKK